MKNKIIFLIALICFSIGEIMAQRVTLTMKTGQTISGKLVTVSDSTITLLLGQPLTEMKIPADHIQSGKMPHNGQLFVQDGRIIILTSEDIKESHNRKTKELYSNPHFAIGASLKKAGKVLMVAGVPCLAAGLVACIAGHTMHVGDDINSSKIKTKNNLIESSYYLLPIGASLTLVGIPIYVEGKKIMDLNINYTGNGAGLALCF